MLRQILFVCTGNTCRSPMAEGIFAGLAGKEFEVSSAGVSAMPGSPMSPESKELLELHGNAVEGFASRMVDETMLREAEAVFCMTEGHLRMLEQMYPEYDEKYHLACDFIEIDGRVGVDVPDPIGMGRPAYESTRRVLQAAAEGILAFLKSRSE